MQLTRIASVALLSLFLLAPTPTEGGSKVRVDKKKLIPTIVTGGNAGNNTGSTIAPKRVVILCTDLGDPSPYMTITTKYRCDNGGLFGYQGCYGVCTPPPPGTPPEPKIDVPALVSSAIRNVPDPEPVTSPPLTDDDDIAVVGIPFFYSVPASQWTTISPVATQGTAFLAINATPSTLTFKPGDGQPGSTCDNPGRSVRTTRQAEAAKRLGCYYTFQNAPSGGATYRATLTIAWNLTVTTNLQPGEYINLVPPTMTTTTNVDVPVVQLQAVLVEPAP